MLFALYSNLAFAVPQQLTQQGRLLDSNDMPVEGVHNLSIQLYDSPFSTNILWGESLSVTFNNGFYVVTLGADSTNALDSLILDEAHLYVEMKIDNDPPLLPRTKISSSPYARMAGIATNVDGGTINASEILINGNVVLDGSGSFVGQSTPEWSSIQNVPSEFSDGVDNDSLANISCSSDNMILSYTEGTWTCGYDDVLDSADVIAIVEGESDITVNLNVNSTLNGESIQTGTDQDTLGDLNCAGGEIPVLDTTNSVWICGTDTDTTLTENEVISMVQNSASLTLALSNSTTVNGEAILTESSSVDWNNLINKPEGLDDGNALDALSCTDGQIAIKVSNGWECRDFSTVLDGDGDGILQWNDCDDGDATKPSNDADCDGIVTTEDCDDSDSTNTDSNVGDADCDGFTYSEDCDDNNIDITTNGTGSSENCPAASCKAILDNGYSLGDGDYWLDPSGTSSFKATCDMNTDGGGWTLVLNYLHTGGTNPPLIAQSTTPLQGSSTLGTNESSSDNWGHASNALMNSFSISELMFYCKTSNHGRVVHFKTSASDVISYVQSGSGSMGGVYDSSSTSSLSLRNSSTLPLHTDGENSRYANQGDSAMTEFPFYSNSGIGNPRAHWGIRGGGTRWECDDHTDNANSHTLHRIWLR